MNRASALRRVIVVSHLMRILITGVSRGIGRKLAQHAIDSGHEVLGCSRTVPEGRPFGGRHFKVDLADTVRLSGMFRQIRKEYGSIDALINNAAVARMAPFLLLRDEEIRRMFELNVFSAFNCIREAVKLFRRSCHPYPSIINLTTVATIYSLEGQMAYAASKAAIEQATRTLAHELAPLNIRVNALGLPPVRTALTRSVPAEKIEALVARQAIPRVCEFSDLVGPIDFLLSEGARMVTGETIFLGGVK
ncbi:SDR family oxidoreductase [Bradyrhizobium sp. ARR65]|uniref:SDR family NAD(P)-dependent oxidoreductase n=1 Tax=Bradyrhizobium sp. ARR65 TaxID=1040989 RepID=UPI0006856A3F|nr:SDR family oxidoreductase [Bradyrhizobium sp. ARR65]